MPNDCLKNVYYALVYPQLLYGIELYANTNKCNLDKLIILNNKILRILQLKSLYTNVISLYSNYNTLPVQMLHVRQILLFVQKYIHFKELLPTVFTNYFIENNTIHEHNTRRCNDLHLSLLHTSYEHRCIINKGSKLWNALPNNLKAKQPTSMFKESVHGYIMLNLIS